MVEHSAVNRAVAGSSPALGAIFMLSFLKCQHSSVAEHWFCKPTVLGSIPSVGSIIPCYPNG